MVALPVDQRILVRTHAERIALVLITEAERKKLGAIAEVVDRCEGRAHVSMTIENQVNPIINFIKSTDALSKRLGPPEQPTEIPEEPPKQLGEARKLLPEPEADDETETLSEDAPVVWAIRPIEEN